MRISMGADNPYASDALEDYLKAKKNANNYLKSCGLNFTIVRLGSFNDEEGTGKIQLKERKNK
ncbi:NAD(P)H-binding [Flavobacterium segetis]|uniref:NAD(P)H-binding n=1 Tax=Flavobacterium segetis TaxID=271157 RepID=A0A1M5J3J4_9FLAO|nr:NAD(P)H-binding protein [Flavobacterium segetis]SHG35134.1 NAD(P)H-binding [Flavobacterium segetis]